MCLKIKNCYLKIYIEICVDKKCVEIRKMLFKNWKWLFENTNQTPHYSFILYCLHFLNGESSNSQAFSLIDVFCSMRERESNIKSATV